MVEKTDVVYGLFEIALKKIETGLMRKKIINCIMLFAFSPLINFCFRP